MDHLNYQEGAPSAQNPPPYSEKQPYNQQPPPAHGPANSAMPTQYQPYYAPYGAVPGQGLIVQPPLHTTYVVPVQPTHEPDYLGYSIFTMLCCCLPLGIAALVYSVQTRDANRMGNSAEAERNSRMARNLAHSALGVGSVLLIVWIVLIVVPSQPESPGISLLRASNPAKEVEDCYTKAGNGGPPLFSSGLETPVKGRHKSAVT